MLDQNNSLPKIKNKLNWKIGGEAGFGIMTTGATFAKTITRAGLNVFGYTEYPSLIRGGHNTYHARVDEEEFYSQIQQVDILVALNKNTIDLHKNELAPNAAVIYDGQKLELDHNDFGREDLLLCPIPLLEIATKLGGEQVMINTVALGATFGLVNFDFSILASVVTDAFSKKGDIVVNLNVNTAKTGFNFIKENYDGRFHIFLEKIKDKPKISPTGNEAIGLGAIAAGCKFYTSYPMTPSSNILHYLASKAEKSDMIVRHGEDEIGVVNMAVGAGFAGVRSMVATAGGGFCLMVETFGLAAMTETPIVIVVGQRPGPATGLPTWTAQADLRFVLHAAQDEFPRIVIAPSDVDECFYQIANAFNIAEKYQTPVIFLTDKHLAESHQSTYRFDKSKIKIDRGQILTETDLQTIGDYKRYKFTQDGVSARTLPGTPKGQFIGNSDEHDEYGISTEDQETRIRIMDKRMKKLETLAKEIPDPYVFGNKNADLSLICWGSNKRIAREVVLWAEKDGIKLNMLNITYINPLKTDFITNFLTSAKNLLVFENNLTAQMAGYLREKTGFNISNKLLKNDGRPFYPEEVYAKVKKILAYVKSKNYLPSYAIN